MSETAGSEFSGGSDGASSAEASHEANQSGNTGTNGGGSYGTERADNKSQKPAAEQAVDEFEDISLGSVKGKVPKSIAKAIKDFERGAQAKFEEAARARKEIQQRQQLLSLLERDPDAFAEQYSKLTGKRFDIDSFAEERLARKYELMTMSPEQRQLHEARQELEQIKQSEMQSKSGVIQEIKDLLGDDAPEGLENYPKEQLQHFLREKQEVYQRVQSDLNREVIEAWTESGLPKHKYFGALMSFHMMSHQKRTNEPLQAKEAAARVKQDFVRAVQEIVTQMDPKGIQELLGDQTLKRIRQFDIDRVTAKAASAVGQQNNRPGVSPASEQPKKPMNEYEWREYVKRMKV